MDDKVIQCHNFEKAKNEIKIFSEQIPTCISLKKVSNNKGAGDYIFDILTFNGIGLEHKVTGEELNELTRQIQTHLCNIRDTQIKLTQKFGLIYNTFEYLDKEYINGIVSNVKAIEKTSESVKEKQEQINRIVDNQRKILEELLNFKEKINETVENQNQVLKELMKFKQEMGDYAKFNDIASLTKQIKQAQVIAVGAAGVAIIAVILLLMKVS